MTSVKGHVRESAPVTVLIADDEPSIRLLVQVTIESRHCTVLEAADGDEAWSLITQHKPSLVLLDVQMPGRNGLDILKSIRSNPSLNTVRVIMLTSRATASDIAAGLAAGADLYLTKPFSPLDLLSRVQKTLHPSPS